MARPDIKKTEIETRVVTRSNQFIEARYKSSIFENKLLALGLTKIKENHGSMKVTINTTELKEVFNCSEAYLYKQAKEIVKYLPTHIMVIDEPENERIVALSVVKRAEYDKGIVKLDFNEDLKSHICSLKRNFTTMKLSTLLGFKNVYAYRLYELLSVHKYKITEEAPVVQVRFSLGDLKMKIGIINAYEDKVRKALNRGEDPNYIAENIAKEKMYPLYSTFKRKVLNKVQEEINGNSDIYIDYMPIRTGRGGKVTSIDFSIRINENVNIEGEKLIKFTTDDIIDVARHVDDRFTGDDIVALLEVANGDKGKIYDAYDLAKEQREIKNFVGFMRRAIEEGWTLKSYNNKGKKQGFNNYPHRDYDFDALKKASFDDCDWEQMSMDINQRYKQA